MAPKGKWKNKQIKVKHKHPESSGFLVSGATAPKTRVTAILKRVKRETQTRVKITSREKSETRVAFSRVGWFSRVLAFRSLYFPWGQMGTTRSLETFTSKNKIPFDNNDSLLWQAVERWHGVTALFKNTRTLQKLTDVCVFRCRQSS